MKPASNPVYWAFLSVLLAAFPALADDSHGHQRNRSTTVPGVATGRTGHATMYLADRNAGRYEAREHRGDRDNRWRTERRQHGDRDDRSYRRDRDYNNRYRTYRYGNSYPYTYRNVYPYGYGNSYPYGYGNSSPYRYGSNGANSSYDRGYRDGIALGRSDFARGYGYNPRRYDRRGDLAYRAGFDAGYNASYGRY